MGWARQTLGVDGNADIIFRLFFDRTATKRDGVLRLWDCRVGLLNPAFLPSRMLPLLSPFLLLQLISFPAVIWVQGGDCVLQRRKKKSLCVKPYEGEPIKLIK